MSVVDHVITIGGALLILVTLALSVVWMLISLRMLSLVRDLSLQYAFLKEKMYEPILYIRFLLSYLSGFSRTRSPKEKTSKEKKKAD